MHVRVPPPPPDSGPRPRQDTQPFDLSRLKPPSIAPAAPVAEVAVAEAAVTVAEVAVAPVVPVASVEPSAAGAATQSAEPHLPPSRVRVVADALPSVMVDDAAKATASSIRGKKKRQWM
jgi:hypothetical protein